MKIFQICRASWPFLIYFPCIKFNHVILLNSSIDLSLTHTHVGRHIFPWLIYSWNLEMLSKARDWLIYSVDFSLGLIVTFTCVCIRGMMLPSMLSRKAQNEILFIYFLGLSWLFLFWDSIYWTCVNKNTVGGLGCRHFGFNLILGLCIRFSFSSMLNHLVKLVIILVAPVCPLTLLRCLTFWKWQYSCPLLFVVEQETKEKKEEIVHVAGVHSDNVCSF